MNAESTNRQLRENVESVFQRVAQACDDAGRDPLEVRVVAVTKYASEELTQQLGVVLNDFLGHCQAPTEPSQPASIQPAILGESRPQVLATKADSWSADFQPDWHMIGHLQTNKIKQVVPRVSLIHSIDRPELLEKIDSYARQNQMQVSGLIQFNISGEENKGGFQPSDWESVIELASKLTNTTLEGVMGMGGLGMNESQTAAQFSLLKETQINLSRSSEKNSSHRWKEVSMGMSGDFELAIKNGSTLVRIGSSFFNGIL